MTMETVTRSSLLSSYDWALWRRLTKKACVIDPLISLAFAIQSNKGVYALLLGSGVSRAAQIPTGWEIVQAFRWRSGSGGIDDCMGRNDNCHCRTLLTI
jgi:hypothetical protein